MTLQETQLKVDEWIREYGGGYFSELTNLGILTEETGELARWMVRRYGDQSLKNSEKEIDMQEAITDEICDVLWVLICLANQTGVDLEKGMKKNIEKKTLRDKTRHTNRDKT